MGKKSDKHLLVAIDIGTTKVVSLVGEVNADNQIEIIGIGSHPSYGMKRGVVVNIESTLQSVQRATEEAELMAGCEIRSAFTGIAGSHISSLNSHGIVAIRDNEVTSADVERVLDAAKAVAIPADQRLLHILPQEYIIDSQDGIREPIGMSGVRLEAKVHMVSGAVSAAENIVKCVRRCGVDVGDVILEQLASSAAVLTEDEKELGVALVDIGGGTSDIAIFTDSAIRHTAVIPIAGDQVTNDLTVALRTPTQSAEDIKLKFASALSELVDRDELINVPGVNQGLGRQVSRAVIAEVVEARYEELFNLIQAEIRRSGFEDLITAGIVFTGGGSKVPGALELAERVFDMPVRLGLPQTIPGIPDTIKDPSFATGVGLLLYAFQQQYTPGHGPMFDQGVNGVWDRMKHWFQGNF